MSPRKVWRGSAILEATTEDDVGEDGARSSERELVFTILAHPDLARAGEIARAKLGKVTLSRVAPDFAQPGSEDAFALADPRISRRPIVFERTTEGGLAVARDAGSAALSIEGAAIGERGELGARQLERGVIMLLADRVCLHLALEDREPRSEETFGLIGESPAIAQLRRQIADACLVDACALVRGETGTGKDLVARALHLAGPRRERPFVTVNIAAVPPTLAASELFGHAKGAFTGAETAREGHFIRADGGTLFLDEIGEAPPEVQVMLLRTLETGVVQRLGDGDERKVDVRLVTATDADLEALAKENNFRPSLLHRLAGYEIFVPALRERRGDLGRLLVASLREELERLGAGALLEPRDPSDEAWLGAEIVDRLARCDWPGNVRQLKNVARYIAVAHRDGPVRWTTALARLVDAGDDVEPAPEKAPVEAPRRKPSEISLEELTKTLIEHEWRMRPTAAALGLSRASLYMLFDRHPELKEAREKALGVLH